MTQIQKKISVERHLIAKILHLNSVEIRNPGFYIRTRKLTQKQKKEMGERLRVSNKGREPVNKLGATEAIFRNYKTNAKRRNKAFKLSLKEFEKFIFSNCFYCGNPPCNFFRFRKNLAINGIDRLDSTLGYIRKNCVSCCNMCNIMKNDYSLGEFLDQVNKIFNFKNKLQNQ